MAEQLSTSRTRTVVPTSAAGRAGRWLNPPRTRPMEWEDPTPAEADVPVTIVPCTSPAQSLPCCQAATTVPRAADTGGGADGPQPVSGDQR